MIYYTKYNCFEIIDGGDNMIMVLGEVFSSIELAKSHCERLEDERRRPKRTIYYF